MTAEKILDIARAELGTKENPPSSNKVKYNTWYYGREVSGSSYPWCMVFVQWVFHQAGAGEMLPVRTASCGALMRAAQSAGCWVTENYQPGDVVIYDFPGGAATDHTGIIESATSSAVTAIEGNTSKSNASDGGEVCRMTRKLNVVKGAWRPNYEEDENMTYEKWKEYMEQYRKELREQPGSDWFQQQDQAAVEALGIFKPDGVVTYPQDLITREQVGALFARYDERRG